MKEDCVIKCATDPSDTLVYYSQADDRPSCCIEFADLREDDEPRLDVMMSEAAGIILDRCDVVALRNALDLWLARTDPGVLNGQ